MVDEGRDAHLRSRLEAFSDIVFGFVVAMLGTHIKVPSTPNELILIRKDLVVFAFSFLLLCALWLRHHRMMRRFFVADSVGTVLVFLVLGMVALYSFPLQLYLHFPDNPLALSAYAWGLSFLCLLYVAMAVYSGRKEGRSWSPGRAKEARRVLVANAILGFAAAAYPLVRDSVLALGILVGAVFAFRFSKSWIEAPERETPVEQP